MTQAGACPVTRERTAAFSACPGCWIQRLRQTGVMDAFLESRAEVTDGTVEEDQVEVKEEMQEDQCVICGRDAGGEQYRERAVCAACRR